MIGGAQPKVLLTQNEDGNLELNKTFEAIFGKELEPKYKLVRERDGMLKTSLGVKWLEFDEDGRLFTESEVDSNMGTGNIKTEYINIEIVINTIKEILNKVKRAEIEPKNAEENTKLLKILQDEYKDFSITHPVVLRWMVEARQYDEQAFRTYAKNHVKSTYKDRNEFWKCQGEYLILLFRRLNPKASVKAIRHYRDNVMGLLKKDNDEFDWKFKS